MEDLPYDETEEDNGKILEQIFNMISQSHKHATMFMLKLTHTVH